MLAKDLFDIELPTREQLYETLFRPIGWDKVWYSGLNLLDFGISDNDIVLDVGGGYRPFPRANVIVEKYINDGTQRGNKPTRKADNQIIIEADASSLPFKDKAFDFVYTSHTLEHVGDLPSALEELSRVGKRGFCALPLGDFGPYTDTEKQGHLWMCRYDNGKLYIRKRKEWEYCEELGKFHEFLHTSGACLNDTKLPYVYWFEQVYRHVWEIRFVWKEQIKYEVYE